MNNLLRKLALGGSAASVILIFALNVAQAQDAPPDATKLWGKAADIEAMADADKKGTIVQIGPYRSVLETRAAGTTSPAATHTANEFFYIIDGTIDVKTGGTLLNGKPNKTGATTLGSGIDGGTTVRISKGDFYIVPANTPHQLSPVGGKVVDMSLLLPVK